MRGWSQRIRNAIGSRTRLKRILLGAALVGVGTLAFQNCSSKLTSKAFSTNLSSLTFAPPSSNQNQDGTTNPDAPSLPPVVPVAPPSQSQAVTITNVNHEVIGSYNANEIAGARVFATIVNPNSGRRVVLSITKDAGTNQVQKIEATGTPYFCLDPRQAPCANVTIPPGYTNAGAQMQNCASPIYFEGALTGSIDNITSDLVCPTLSAEQPLAATPWRRSYNGAWAAVVIGDGGATSNVYTLNGTENKNYLLEQFGSAGECDSTTLNPISCSDVQGPNDPKPGRPKAAGVFNGVYDDDVDTYHSFITMGVRPAGSFFSSGELTELGPVAWPANGYLARRNGGVLNEAAGGGLGLVTGTMIVDQAKQYLYMFYADRSHGVHLPSDPNYDGRGSGMKVIRAPLGPNNTIDPLAFKSYFKGKFEESALPKGFRKERIQDFYDVPGGRSDDIFGTPLKVYGRLGIARIKNSPYYISASQEGVGSQADVWLRVSKDLVNWSTPALIPALHVDNPEWWRFTKFLNSTFLNSSGVDTSEIDANDFYLLGTDTGQASLNRIHLSLTINDNALSVTALGDVDKVSINGEGALLETVPSIVSLKNQPLGVMFATDWTNRCAVTGDFVNGITIKNCGLITQPDLRVNGYHPLPADPTTQVRFTSINGQKAGTFSTIGLPADQDQFFYRSFNDDSGRRVRLKIFVAPSTRSILGIRADGPDRYCYDPAQVPCADVAIPDGFPNAGQLTRNCSSPVYFAGAVNGSLSNLSADLSCDGTNGKSVVTSTGNPTVLTTIYRGLSSTLGYLFSTYMREASDSFPHQKVAFQLSTNPGDNLVPLYRCRAGGEHFVSPFASCEGFDQESILGYMFAKPRSSLKALHRYVDPSRNRHLATIDPAEGAGMTDEGIIGYVFEP